MAGTPAALRLGSGAARTACAADGGSAGRAEWPQSSGVGTSAGATRLAAAAAAMSWRGYVSRSVRNVRFIVDNAQMDKGGSCFGVR